MTNFQTCDSQNLLVCSFAADLEGAAKEVGAVATVTAYAGSSYANSKVDPTYACTSDPLKKVTLLLFLNFIYASFLSIMMHRSGLSAVVLSRSLGLRKLETCSQFTFFSCHFTATL